MVIFSEKENNYMANRTKLLQSVWWLCYELDWDSIPGKIWKGTFSYHRVQMVLEPTQLPIQWAPGR